MGRLPLVLTFFLALCGPAQAETLARHVETMRDYDLVELDGARPSRPLRFYIGDNSRFAICGRCLCGTGIMIGRYPQLGIRPTSASPTFSCEQGTPAFKADAAMVAGFFDMKWAKVTDGLLVLQGPEDRQMVFRLGGSNLSPP